ncbi:MAG: SDR family NAD(P)-dependent oxidoreductase [Lachnospiraceae bacterium]|nr:SDR family NAD(P)-dependent oxidoreductase [Lachnospiraceae bacterium]
MKKKIAIITGASSGLGREFVRQLDKKMETFREKSAGAEKLKENPKEKSNDILDEMWVIARREDRLNELRSQISTTLRVMPLDLTKKESFQTIRTLLEGEQPDVRYLINAAGFGKIGSWKDISIEDCDDMINLNCRAAMDMTQLVLPFMNRGANVLEICSTAGFQPFPYLNVYSASKAFLYRYSRALRVELMGEGIHVTAVCPYWVKDTEFIGTAQNTENSTYIRHFQLASREKNVVRHALMDSELGLPVSTPGLVCTVHRIAAKFIPSEVMMGIWAFLRRI